MVKRRSKRFKSVKWSIYFLKRSKFSIRFEVKFEKVIKWCKYSKRGTIVFGKGQKGFTTYRKGVKSVILSYLLFKTKCWEKV